MTEQKVQSSDQTNLKGAISPVCYPFPQNYMLNHVKDMSLHVMPGMRSIGTYFYRL